MVDECNDRSGGESRNIKTSKLVIGAIVLFIVTCVIAVAVTWSITKKHYSSKSPQAQVDNVKVGFQVGKFSLKEKLQVSIKRETGVVLTGGLYHSGIQSDPGTCGISSNKICLEWKNDKKLEIIYESSKEAECYNISWQAQNCVQQELGDCFDLGDGHWYGGYEDYYQPWPLEKTTRNTSAFLARDSYQKEIGGVLDRYFISTNGIGMTIDDSVPLYISINASSDGKICFKSKYDKYPYINPMGIFPVLKYRICTADNVRKIHDYMTQRYFDKPEDIPDRTLFRYPIWSTWAQYHNDINQSTVMTFAHKIIEHNFSHSQLEIDDDWTPHYGDMTFNVSKFPNALQMVQDLNNLGFRVTVWLHPFFNIDSDAFTTCETNGYLIRQYDSKLPALVSWWDGDLAGILDVSNDEAVEWFLNRTKDLQEIYNVSSFKFDAGETAWLPNIFSPADSKYKDNFYPMKWANLAFNSDKNIRHQEVRVGYKTQNLPIFVRMLDKDSNWDHANGLKSLIPTALTFGIVGYPFILPDMIGGNAYYNHPDEELFIRWLQATVFMPSLQFSIVPWQYNDKVINISRTLVQLHENYSEIFINLAKESTQNGAPIIRPLWWIAPNDRIAQVIDSEFLVGDDILVAPVLSQGATMRDIYLPEGMWVDQLRHDVKEGGSWYRNYTALLHELPYFVRKVN